MKEDRPEVKCSMMAAKTSGFSTLQTYSSLFVTVTKSDPKNTPDTPSMANRRFASGELMPSLAESKLLDPLCTPHSPHQHTPTSGLLRCKLAGTECASQQDRCTWPQCAAMQSGHRHIQRQGFL